MKLLHTNAVSLEGSGLLITGPSGSGKSDLTLRLMDAGWSLVGDDYCNVWAEDDCLWAKPHDNTKGKVEVRGLGIIDVPFAPKTKIVGMIELMPNIDEIDRMPKITQKKQENINLFYLKVYPFEQSAPIKIKYFIKKISGYISE
jgi:serine kinase of HPr protein (carbohydrate metabolism regulator)